MHACFQDPARRGHCICSVTDPALGFPRQIGPRSRDRRPTNRRGHLRGNQQVRPCHFAQFQQWKQDSHARSFEILPAKYRQDAGCLKCHTTGYGTPSGYQDESTSGLAGTTCEACHGPGSEHVVIAQRLVDVEVTADAERQLRESIQKVKSENACVQCHLNKAHKDPHPKFDQDP